MAHGFGFDSTPIPEAEPTLWHAADAGTGSPVSAQSTDSTPWHVNGSHGIAKSYDPGSAGTTGYADPAAPASTASPKPTSTPTPTSTPNNTPWNLNGTSVNGAPTTVSSTYATGEPVNGAPAPGEHTSGTYAHGESVNGTYATDEHTSGVYARGESVKGAPAPGEQTSGAYAQGESVNGTYASGEQTSGTYAHGESVNGTYLNSADADGDTAAPAPSVLPPTSADLARRIRAAAASSPAATRGQGAQAGGQTEHNPAEASAPPLVPRRRTAPEADTASEFAARGAQEPVGATEPSPLPRRTRNRSAVRESTPQVPAALADAQLLDAEAARAAVEEFEAGVEEALRASAQDLPIVRASDEPEGIRP
ncbi:hypothetical protein KDK95_34450 [Actinospica sp. MGRD01-02]|uniref:Uncharacterized protein n=1 Tax=Actinospica acidithermotolerans TaxID=2828514 RepID=A0A941IK46_9ACTN|nr:hypothetical protein [Actinospica acidithermotolerans]MBR7831450.1 hypothetical protein [Actinospica acidithermotolerans]